MLRRFTTLWCGAFLLSACGDDDSNATTNASSESSTAGEESTTNTPSTTADTTADASTSSSESSTGTADSSSSTDSSGSTDTSGSSDGSSSGSTDGSSSGTTDASTTGTTDATTEGTTDGSTGTTDASTTGTTDGTTGTTGEPGACVLSDAADFSNAVGGGIADFTTLVAPVDVSGVDPYLWGVTVTTNITHTYAADLDIALRSPSGTLVTLSTDNGSSSVDVFDGTVWSDAANEPVTEYTFTTGVLAAALTAESAFGAFRGEDPNGTWQLEVGDDAGGDVGTLSGWTISLVTAAPDPIDSTETFSSENIIDFGPVNSEDTIDVAGPASICGITVTTNITHPYSADMDLFVISPAGTIVTLSTANASSFDDVFNGTVWSDAANTPVTDYLFTDLVAAPTLTPEGALSTVVGEDPTGIWTLVLDDTFPNSDDGVSNGWSIDIVACDCN